MQIVLAPYNDPFEVDSPEQSALILAALNERLREWEGGPLQYQLRETNHGRGADWRTAYMKLSTGTGFTSTTWSVVNQWNQGAYTFAGDFNGDSIDDIASCGGSVCYMKQSTGSGFVNPGNEAIDPTWNNAGFTYVGDFEGDGNDDIASAAYALVYMKLVSQ